MVRLCLQQKQAIVNVIINIILNYFTRVAREVVEENCNEFGVEQEPPVRRRVVYYRAHQFDYISNVAKDDLDEVYARVTKERDRNTLSERAFFTHYR